MLKVPTNGRELDAQPQANMECMEPPEENVGRERQPIAEYQYDDQMRRTTSTVSGISITMTKWRSVKERLGAATAAERQHVWQPGNHLHLIFRDRSTANNGTMNERLYSLKDELVPCPAIACAMNLPVTEAELNHGPPSPVFVNTRQEQAARKMAEVTPLLTETVSHHLRR